MIPLYLLHMLNDGVRATYTILLPFIAKDLSLSLSQVGLLGGSQGIFMMLFAIPGGYLATRFGGLRILLTCLFIYSLGALGVASSLHVIPIFIAFYIGALGFSVFHPIGYALVAQFSQKAQLGKQMGNFTSFGEIGKSILPPMSIFLTTLVGWRATIGAIGCAGLLVYLIVYLRTSSHQYPVKKVAVENHGSWLKSLIIVSTQPRLFFTIISGMSDIISCDIITIFLPFILLAKGVSVTTLGIIVAIFFIGSVAGKNFLGRAVDLFGNIRVYVIAQVLTACFIFALIHTMQVYILGGLAFLLGTFTRGTSSVMHTLISDSAGKFSYEKVFAVSEIFTGIATAGAPILAGFIADHYGLPSVMYISLVMALLSIIPVAGIRGSVNG